MFDVKPYDRTHLSGILALCIAEGWMSFAADPDRAHRVLTAPGVTTAVAVDGAGGSGEVVGFAQILSDGEIQAYLANLLVAESRRGQGVARSLLEHAHARGGGERVSLLSEEGADRLLRRLDASTETGVPDLSPVRITSGGDRPLREWPTRPLICPRGGIRLSRSRGAVWQRRWEEDGTYRVDLDDPRSPYYVLSMYPYPSGPAHQGHIRNYTFGDVLVRHRTMQGHAVLSPVRVRLVRPSCRERCDQGRRPTRDFTPKRASPSSRRPCMRLGAVYDWRRELNSHDPDYMNMESVHLHSSLLRSGLAYRDEAPVNWCPGCHTVLANEQVLADGTCERSGDVVERRSSSSGSSASRAYADELLDALTASTGPSV